MDFGKAIEALKRGDKVTREGWNGKGMFIWLKPPCVIKQEWCKDNILRSIAEENGGEVEGLGTICMKTADNKVLTGWLASQTDILSEDWKIWVENEWDSISPDEKPTYDQINRTADRGDKVFDNAVKKYRDDAASSANPEYDKAEDFLYDVFREEDGGDGKLGGFIKMHKIPEPTSEEKEMFESVKKFIEREKEKLNAGNK